MDILSKLHKNMNNSIQHFQDELLKIRAGRASATMLNGIFVNYYNSSVTIENVANITTPDARTIILQPWEKNMISTIEKAILSSNIGLTPQNDGNSIKLYLPPLTEERRKELSKKVLSEGENIKIVLRNHRREAIEAFRKITKDQSLSKDALKGKENTVQEITDKYISNIDLLCKEKEAEIMKV